MRAEDILRELTLEEKCSLLSGKDFWNTKSLIRFGIKEVMMTDGPHGLRKQAIDSSEVELEESVPATCFPSGAALASTWNKKLIERAAEAIAEECLENDVDMLLGPAVNIKRSPLCGRNFEYYSEDPVISSKIAKHFIKGVQSKGVSACIKHFAANNQEYRRLTTDVIVDERALREIYLKSFEEAIKEGKPDAVMCAYNKINGTYASDNKYLLNDILRQEWGFEGVVISDWGAVNDRVDALIAGLDIEMPSSYGVNDKRVYEAIKKGEVSEEELDKVVLRILNFILKHQEKTDKIKVDKEKHHQLACEVAKEAIVLLKNEDNILPLDMSKKIAVIGEFAKKSRYQGGGSSHVNPTKIENAYDNILKYSNSVKYSDGFIVDSDEINENLLKEAVEVSKEADIVVLFLGLPERYESEGFDRVDMKLPNNQNILVEKILEVNKNVVVVLSIGSPVEMPWAKSVKGILNGYLLGQAGGSAIASILFGESSPSGKLSETFPIELDDNPSYLDFPGSNDIVKYGEGIFVGYRYYDFKNMNVLFPFGHGLSYTKFEYTNLSTNKDTYNEDEDINVVVKIKNTGNIKAKEVIQVYVQCVNSKVIRPIKELKAFEKVELDIGEEKEVLIKLNGNEFSYFNEKLGKFYVEEGEYEILVGSSSRDIRLEKRIKIEKVKEEKQRFHLNSTIQDVIKTEMGKKLLKDLVKEIGKADEDNVQQKMMKEFYLNLPLRGLLYYSDGKYDLEKLEKLIEVLNS
ncbi:MAG: glycoside hydrolase family 3 C-terminal domain-containing protein [Clostridiales bacterium]|nr:glycoside hydrolase family 3 C-terminal domain-containing protein [Clostridiales bacterium]